MCICTLGLGHAHGMCSVLKKQSGGSQARAQAWLSEAEAGAPVGLSCIKQLNGGRRGVWGGSLLAAVETPLDSFKHSPPQALSPGTLDWGGSAMGADTSSCSGFPSHAHLVEGKPSTPKLHTSCGRRHGTC